MYKKAGYLIDKIKGENPFVFIDVGAMGGIPVKWNRFLDVMKVIAFEPDFREFSKLKSNHRLKYFNFALSDKAKDLKYFIAKESGKSSMFHANMKILSQYEAAARYEVVKEEVISAEKVRNLDAVMEENSIFDADFIKLDTQGSELLILQGGINRLMPKIFGAQIESEFVQLYKNQPLFRHIDEFMDSYGFQLIDIRRQYWKRKDYYSYRGKGQLIFGDALYLKKIDIFYEKLFLMKDESYVITKIFKAILTCLVYNLFDYAVSVAKSGFEAGYVKSGEYDKIISIITKCSTGGFLSKFSMNRRIYNFLTAIMDKFRPASYLGWADSDRVIANIKDR